MNDINRQFQQRPFSRHGRSAQLKHRRLIQDSPSESTRGQPITNRIAFGLLKELEDKEKKEKLDARPTKNSISFLATPREKQVRLQPQEITLQPLAIPKYSLVQKRSPYSIDGTPKSFCNSRLKSIKHLSVDSQPKTTPRMRSVVTTKKQVSIFPIDDSKLAIAYIKTNPDACLLYTSDAADE